MGVLNVTPDSFSDGGRYDDLDAAVAHGVEMLRQGADLVDIGGESTRPGADRVDAAEEIRRTVPVIRELRSGGVPMSIDTTRAAVAAAALEAGVTVVNDVSGGLADPDMARVVADAGCPWVLMHWRGHSRDMQALAVYKDVVAEVRAELLARVDDAVAKGVPAERLIIDPGLGFAKTAEHNWELLRHLRELAAIGLPVLVGASRKSFLGALLASADGSPRPADRREAATVATSLLAADAGVWGVRVHEVEATVDALRVHAAGRPSTPDAPRDKIVLRGLRVRGRHGVYQFERERGQDFVIDVSLELDTRPAAAVDDVTATVHYGELADKLALVAAGDPVDLIETLAARLADVCMAEHKVRACEVTVHKPNAPIEHEFSDVSVVIRRERS